MVVLESPLGRSVRVVEQGGGPSVVFLHGGVGGPGEWRSVFECWSDRNRLIAIDACGLGSGPAHGCTLDDYADLVRAVAEHVDEPVHLVGFSAGGATALRVATTTPSILASLSVIEPQAYSLLQREHPDAFATITAMRDRWRQHVAAGRWHEAFAAFLDHYNGPGSFDAWPADRREAFLEDQKARGDLWDVLFDSSVSPQVLESIDVPTLLVEGGQTAQVERALCEVVRRHVPACRHHVIDVAGHMMPVTHPQQLTEALRAHVGSVPATGR